MLMIGLANVINYLINAESRNEQQNIYVYSKSLKKNILSQTCINL